MNRLPGGWKKVHQQKLRELCIQMELSGKVKETANTKIKAHNGLMTCRKTRQRFLQSEVCNADNLAHFAERIAVQNAEGCTKVYVPIDGSSLKIPDSTGNKGLGHVGPKSAGAKGFIVQNSYMVDQDGIPCGILYQKYFTRPADECESKIWADTLETTIRIIRKNNLAECALIEMDRGYDCPEIINWLRTKDVKLMIRATQNRKVCSPDVTSTKEARELSCPVLEYLSDIPEMATIDVSVPVVLRDKETPAGTSNVSTTERRTCTLSLKSAPVQIFLRPKKLRDLPRNATVDKSEREWLSPATIVLAEELNAPQEYAPVRWIALRV
ncbi:MAG: transposase [Treponema sp.]|nr:transposase [Treponema sp.]